VAQDTYGQIWNRLLLYAPGTPVPLVQQFIKNAYRRALDYHNWSELLKDGELTLPDLYNTGTVAVTNGSTGVTGSGTTFTTAMTGRQIRVLDSDGGPYYTVTYVSGTSLTLDRAYQGVTDASSTFEIGQFYIELPSDLTALDDIRDVDANWRLRRQFHQQNYIDFIDPKRENEGSPTLYVAAPPRVASGVAFPRFEFYPRIPAGTHLVYRYYGDSELSSNSSYPVTMIKPEAITFGALSELAMWPGLPDRPNPYFNMDIHKEYDKMFMDALQDSELADLERSQRMLIYPDGDGFPNDANFIQSHGLVPRD
jgi:hypothetical protein